MLDDLAFIHRVDKSDTLGIAENEPEQLLHDFKLYLQPSNFNNVVYAGMGGSALAAILSLTWPTYNVPFEVVRNYDLPAYVSSDSLCIVSSTSGNTEEALSIISQAEERHARIVVITGGGKLLEIAQQKNYPVYVMPLVKQPRYGVFYNFKALVEIGNCFGIVTENALQELTEVVPYLREKVKNWAAEVPVKDNLAKQLALDCLGKSIVIYGGPKMSPAAYKWKISFNENAKQVAWTGVYPEFNHNEFIGWSEQPIDKPYQIIDLRSTFENSRVQKRFVLSDRLLSGKRPAPSVIDLAGNSLLEQMLYAVLLGDFTTLYCAIAAETNPEPVELIEKFKGMLKES